MAIGFLYIVATPIGNLQDFTFRSHEILNSCDLILSEDTRETQKLLDHYKIKVKQISYRDENHEKVFLSVLNDLLNGKNIALVSDSGTPLISDPGYKLIRDLRKNNFNNILSLPGPSAVISALSISGLPTDKFCFLGFLPKKTQDKSKELVKYKSFDSTLVLYESPFRVKELLEVIANTLGDRFCCICAELTKINERVYNGSATNLLDTLTEKDLKGEFVVLVAKEGYKYE